jgi:hypothetical protein
VNEQPQSGLATNWLIEITATLTVGGYFLLENMSIMYRNSVINATTNVMAKNINVNASYTDTGFTSFRKYRQTALLYGCSP